MEKRTTIYNLKVNKETMELAKEWCNDNFISLPNEVRKLLSMYANKQKEKVESEK